MLIVDVSDNNPPDRHPSELDWKLAIADDVVGVIIKYTQGMTETDESAQLHSWLAYNAGVPLFGAYHFGSSAGTPSMQATRFIEAVKNDWGPKFDQCKLMLDLESNAGLTMNVNAGEQFVQTIKQQTGRWPLLYMGRFGPNNTGVGLPNPILSQCDLMLPAFGPHEDNLGEVLPKGFKLPENADDTGGVVRLWQFSDGTHNGGAVAGLGRVDQSKPIGFDNIDQLMTWWMK